MSGYFVEPFVDSGLGNSAYLIGSHDTRKGVVIDPLRDVDQYVAAAHQHGIQLTHVLDTHLHADFISGNRELAAQTGARIGASAQAGLAFEHQPLSEDDHLDLGAFQLRVLATPGHTPEHLTFLILEEGGKRPTAMFSGGALIVGGAARTDLITPELSEPLAHQLYHTFREKLLKLPDEVTVYPTHGAGSFCVAPVSSDRTSTIGREKITNPLMQTRTEKEFVRLALTNLPSYPAYYKFMRAVNQKGAEILGGLPVLTPLLAEEVQALSDAGAVLLDVRHNREYGAGHIPGSYGIRHDAPLTTWAGWLIPFGSRLVLIANSSDERQSAIRQLIRIGYDNLAGYLEGGIETWNAAGYPIDTVPSIEVNDLHDRLVELTVIDVRQLSEWQAAHIPGAIHFEAGRIPGDDPPFTNDKPVAILCSSGNRSMAAISVLRRKGYRNLIQVEGGFNKWRKNGYESVAGS